MDAYNHFQYGLMLAEKLRPIAHSDKNRRFFRAFGIEGLLELHDVLSSVGGMILIAVDGVEKELKYSHDTITSIPQYAFIVAKETASDDSDTVFQSVSECEAVCSQISARLVRDFLYGGSGISRVSASFQVNGTGPIGDNFYGAMLSFDMKGMFRAVLDKDMWED